MSSEWITTDSPNSFYTENWRRDRGLSVDKSRGIKIPFAVRSTSVTSHMQTWSIWQLTAMSGVTHAVRVWPASKKTERSGSVNGGRDVTKQLCSNQELTTYALSAAADAPHALDCSVTRGLIREVDKQSRPSSSEPTDHLEMRVMEK